ncbi:MAG: hypothetical protein KC646_09890 [Candidatus Cloacimonetes bacterium]|nr:hypothetical protein [Candidatus Cloacimonadota bacterium]
MTLDKIILKTLLFVTLITNSVFSNELSQMEPLLEKLFNILDVRNQEILSIEQNITHNRSDLEKKALIRILKQKVRDFIVKDKQIVGALDQIKSSKNEEHRFLYKKSLDRLDSYRSNINQIQELYFRKPTLISPEVKVSTGKNNFENFLTTWEGKSTKRDYSKRVTRATIPLEQKKYFDHQADQNKMQKSQQANYGKFLKELTVDNSIKKKTLVAKKDLSNLDKFHKQLKAEKPTAVKRMSKDQSFSGFFNNLEQNVQTQQARKPTRSIKNGSVSPFQVPKDYEKQLRTPTPKVSPMVRLMEDLDRLKVKQRSKSKFHQDTKSEQSFQGFMSQLELSNKQSQSKPKAKGSFQDLLAMGSKTKTQPEVIQKKSSFADLQQALVDPKKVTDKRVEVKQVQVVGKKQQFNQYLAAIPEVNHQATPVPRPLPQQPTTNRFQVILNNLRHDNGTSLNKAHIVVSPVEEKLENQLTTVFKARKDTIVKDPITIKGSTQPNFSSFPSNSTHLRSSHNKSEIGLNLAELPAEKPIGSKAAKNDSPESKNNEMTASKPKKTESSTPDKQAVDLMDRTEYRVARKAEARLLRRGSHLIPISIEARDVKDRLYPDLPIKFVIEMKPKNFLTGHILDSYTDSPWERVVETNPEGVAQIQVLLNLEGKEVNISRKLNTTREETTCNIVITPKL